MPFSENQFTGVPLGAPVGRSAPGAKLMRKPKGASPEAYAAAEAALKDFWGVRCNGGQEALRLLEQTLGGHGLSAGQLDRLRMELPPINRATVTGAKVLRADSVLRRLVAAAGD